MFRNFRSASNVERQQDDSTEPLLPTNAVSGAENGGSSSLSLTSNDSLTSSAMHTHSDDSCAMNPNVRYTLMYTGLAFAGRSIWNQSVLSTYVYLISNNNPKAVGLITAVMGIAQLIASVPTGYVADKYRRDTMLKLAAVVGMVAIAVTLVALYVLPGSYLTLVLALAVWGTFWGITNTAVDALFADAIPDGYRAYYFTKRSMLITLGNTMGPSLALIMFFVLGDEWNIRDCALVMTLGQAVCLPAVFILAMLNDDESKGSRASRTSSELTEPLLESNNSSCMNEDEESPPNLSEESPSLSCEYIEFAQTQQMSSQTREFVYWCIPKHRLAPILISMADLTSGLASGMSIRYFPIFFLERLHLSPVDVQVLYIVAPLLQTWFLNSGQRFSERWGRCQVTLLYKYIGVACMVLLVVFSHYGFPSWIICVLYVLRTALMNSTLPLTKSILMDNVPTHERGRWSALVSVNMFSWSGSAALGGFLVSFDGLLFNFSVTATMQLLATVPVLALMLATECDDIRSISDTDQSSVSVDSTDGQEEPLPLAPPSSEECLQTTQQIGTN